MSPVKSPYILCFYRTATSQFQWMCKKEVLHFILGVLGPNHMVLTMEQPACRPKPKCGFLAFRKPGKQRKVHRPMSSRWPQWSQSPTLENSHLQLSESAPQHIIISSLIATTEYVVKIKTALQFYCNMLQDVSALVCVAVTKGGHRNIWILAA